MRCIEQCRSRAGASIGIDGLNAIIQFPSLNVRQFVRPDTGQVYQVYGNISLSEPERLFEDFFP